ncbi:MAG: type II secretion system F family protein [Chloroflexota bacterium]|nr:type II secretion system F family protein [Chloroflexota bacterium]
MDSSMFIAVMAFVGTLAVAFVVSTLAERRQPAVVRRRLDDHAVDVRLSEAKRLDRIKVLKGQTYSSIPALNAMLARFKPARTAALDLLYSQVRLSVPQYLLLRLVLAVGLYFALQAVGWGALLSASAGLVGLMLPRVLLILQARRRRAAFEAQLAEAIDLLVGALRSGHGFIQGIEAVARDIGQPMSGELTRVIEEINLGVNPTDALEAITQRIESYDFTLFGTAVSIQRSVGGNLAEVLENIANTVRERRRVRAEVKALTTGPRVSAYVLCLIPVGLLAFFSAVKDEYREVMFLSPFGRFMIGFAVVWSLLGLFFTSKVAKVEY